MQMFLQSILHPEFFDIFGVFVFLFISIMSGWSLKTKQSLPRWAIIIFLIIGILGLIVDGIIVSTIYVF
ncbi:MAG: hypothetical protein KAV41_02145 [Candidatus Pacebacteria bacterium]|nr:hypothetical protein [Candidatus Paceibacterota bacterium]